MNVVATALGIGGLLVLIGGLAVLIYTAATNASNPLEVDR